MGAGHCATSSRQYVTLGQLAVARYPSNKVVPGQYATVDMGGPPEGSAFTLRTLPIMSRPGHGGGEKT
jgi:hypothetical protein